MSRFFKNLRQNTDSLFSGTKNTAQAAAELPLSEIIGGPIGVMLVSAATYKAITESSDELRNGNLQRAYEAALAGAAEATEALPHFIPGLKIAITPEESVMLSKSVAQAIIDGNTNEPKKTFTELFTKKRQGFEYNLGKEAFAKSSGRGMQLYLKGIAAATHNPALNLLAKDKNVQQAYENVAKDTFDLFGKGDFSAKHTFGLIYSYRRLDGAISELSKGLGQVYTSATSIRKSVFDQVRATGTSIGDVTIGVANKVSSETAYTFNKMKHDFTSLFSGGSNNEEEFRSK